MKKWLAIVIVTSSLFWLSGCFGPTGKPGGRYSTKDCKPIPVDPNRVAEKIVIKQKEHKLYVYHNGKVIKTFRVSLGKNTMSKGPKVKEGDYCTPVGTYRIVDKRCHSIKYRAMTISYPNEQDRLRAQKLGVKPGSYITFHGQPYWNRDGHGDSYTLSHDWTNGCIALTNKDLDWLWSAVKPGTLIVIER
ncbi:L,D-transpeptidase family protein [Nitratifractor sp.]